MKPLDHHGMTVLASVGVGETARAVAAQVRRAQRWAAPILGMEVAFELVVASEADWDDVAQVPVRLPHADQDRVTVGAERGPFFTDVVRAYLPYVTPGTRARLEAAYGPDLDLRPFVDAIVVHELGHVYHLQVPFEFPRFWLAEFFANLVMVGYVAEVEPALQPMVDAFARAAVETPGSAQAVSALDDMAQSLDVGASAYVWYQMVLIEFATRLWHAAGAEGLRAVFDRFRTTDMTDGELREALRAVHPTAEAVVTDWPG